MSDKNDIIKQNERLDDLQIDGLMIIQNPDMYCFTSDAVALANYVTNAKGKIVADLGTGSGIIAILITYKQQPKKVIGIELQTYMADMAHRSVEYNNLSNSIDIIEGDILNATNLLGYESVDIVVSNPPYRKCGSGEKQAVTEIAISRHEIAITLEQLVENASKILKYKGRFYLVHRFDRLAEIFYVMKKYNIEPKEIKFINGADMQPISVLIKGVKKGNVGLSIIT
ncbi:MAG: methyltransferase [Clostridia bacterium]